MPEGIQNIINQITEVWKKLDNLKKIYIGAGIGATILAYVLVAGYSSKPARTLLFENLRSADYGAISKALETMGYDWSGSGTSSIYVSSQKRQEIITKLSQDNLLPPGIEGWEIFNKSKWDETTFDKNVKLHRAIKGELERMLMTLDYVKRAKVNLTIPKQSIFDPTSNDVTASVVLVLKPGIDNVHPKKVKGLKNLIASSVSGLKTKNVKITDQTGKEFTEPDRLDLAQRELDLVERKKRFEDRERRRIMNEISAKLKKFYDDDRISVVRVALNINWDEVNRRCTGPCHGENHQGDRW